MKRLEFLFWVEIFMTPTAAMSDIVLPAASTWESENVVTWGEIIGYPNILGNYMRYRRPVISQPYERRGDLQILCELSQAFDFKDPVFDSGVEGCLNHKIAPSGYTLDQVKANPAGIYCEKILPRYAKYAERDEKTGNYKGVITQTKKLELYSTTFNDHGYDPLPDFIEPKVSPISQPELAKKFPLIVIDARRRYMTQSQCAGLPAIRQKMPYAYADIHPDTAKTYGIKDGDMMYIATKNGRIKQQAHVTNTIHPKVICCTFGWWQGCPQLGIPQPDFLGNESSNYSVIISADVHDPISGSYPLNGYLCAISPAGKPDPIPGGKIDRKLGLTTD